MRTPRSVLMLVALVSSACSGGGDVPSDGSTTDGDVPPGCTGDPITTDGVLDLDLAVVRVSGAVTVNHAALPNPGSGALQFVETTSRASYTAELAGSGGHYVVLLSPGHYDVVFGGTASTCATATSPVLPCNSGTIETNVNLTADGVLDLDIPAVHISGAVTVDGAVLADETAARGSIDFITPGATTGLSLSLGATHPGAYAATLVPGTYDVRFDGNRALCEVPPAPQVPCNTGTIEHAIALTSSGILDLDIPAVQVSGAITVKGAQLAGATVNRGSIDFVPPGETSGAGISLGTTRAGLYAATLLPGSYDVRFEGNDALCAVPPAPQLPCNAGPIKTAVALTSNGVLDLDIPAVQISGAITAKGAVLAGETVDRGTIAFVTPGAAAGASISLGATRPGTYAATLLPGTYDVRFEGNAALCEVPPAPQLPCNAGTIKPAVALSSNGVLDLDIPTVQVSGAITVNGVVLAGETTDRGAIAFVTPPGAASGFRVSLGATRPASYAATLLPGSYDVRFEGNDALCAVPPAPQAPCNGGTIKNALALTSNGVLDLDIPAVRITGAVALAGMVMPDLTIDRGALRFSMVRGGAGSARFPAMGAASYAMTLLPGNYVVTYAANPRICASTPSTLAPPCNNQILRGCE